MLDFTFIGLGTWLIFKLFSGVRDWDTSRLGWKLMVLLRAINWSGAGGCVRLHG
jgi:hypothetical protein